MQIKLHFLRDVVVRGQMPKQAPRHSTVTAGTAAFALPWGRRNIVCWQQQPFEGCPWDIPKMCFLL